MSAGWVFPRVWLLLKHKLKFLPRILLFSVSMSFSLLQEDQVYSLSDFDTMIQLNFPAKLFSCLSTIL